jgi:hypothetical protein
MISQRGFTLDEPRAKAIAAIGLLTDVASCGLFDRVGAARTPAQRSAIEQNIIQGELGRAKRNYWALVEGIVVFDEIAYDQYAFTRYAMELKTRERVESLRQFGLSARSWPVSIYESTLTRLRAFRKYLVDNDLKDVAKQTPTNPAEPYGPTNDAFWDSQEKYHHDGLFLDSERSQYSFANTNESFERAFFYVELANALGASLLPRSYSSGTILDMVARSYSQCAHQLVLRGLTNFDSNIRPAELVLPMPPLAEKIAWSCLRTGRTPIDVAAEIRASKGAIAYRRHIADLQALIQGSMRREPASIQELERLKQDFARTVAQWTEDGTAKAGIRYKVRKLKVQLVPTAASIVTYLSTNNFMESSLVGFGTAALQSTFGDSITVRDPILWGGEKYLAFVADWYDYR